MAEFPDIIECYDWSLEKLLKHPDPNSQQKFRKALAKVINTQLTPSVTKQILDRGLDLRTLNNILQIDSPDAKSPRIGSLDSVALECFVDQAVRDKLGVHDEINNPVYCDTPALKSAVLAAREALKEAVFRELRNSQTPVRLKTHGASLHAIYLLIQACFESRCCSVTDLSAHLGVPEFAVHAALRNVRVGAEYSIERVKRYLVVPFMPIDSDHFLEFVSQRNEPEGWERQRKLCTAERAGDALRRILSRKIFFHTDRWRKPIHGILAEISLNNGNYKKLLRSAYYFAATHLGTEDMASAAIADFGGDRWKQIIHQDPKSSDSHLNYSNRWIADWCAERLSRDRINAPSRGGGDNVVRVVEGGVGGAHTTYWLVNALLRAMDGNRSEWSIEYRGFDIVPHVAEEMDGLLKGGNPAGIAECDARIELFSSLSRTRFRPLTEQADFSFVDNFSMEAGVTGLLGYKWHKAQKGLVGTIDLFVSSYAFHHVPNGEDLVAYLSGDAIHDGLPTLGSEQPSVQKDFCTTVLKACESILKASERGDLSCQQQLLREISVGPANVFVSLLCPENLRKRYSELKKLLNGGLVASQWRFPDALLTYLLRNPQKDMLGGIHSLLRPNGIIAIADPDGTSSFNATFIKKDPELSIANFVDLKQIERLLSESGFRVEALYTIGRKDGGLEKYHGYPRRDPVRMRNGSGEAKPDDPNLGYVVFARKSELIF